MICAASLRRCAPLVMLATLAVAALSGAAAATPLVAKAGAVGLARSVGAPQAESRSARLEALRRTRRDEVRPPERESLEEGFFRIESNYLIERLQAGWRGFHPVFGGLPTGSGLGLGFRYIDEAVGRVYLDPDQPNRFDVAWGAVGSFKSYVDADAVVTVRNVGASQFDVSGTVHYRRYPQEDFFGLGAGSVVADRTSYLLEDLEIAADVWWNSPEWLRLGAGFAHIDTNTGPGSDDRFPSIEETFTPAEVPGLDRQPSYFRTGGRVEIDWRDATFNPRQGGYYALRAFHFDEPDRTDLDFRRYEIALHQYFPFLDKHRVFAVRAEAVFSDTDAGSAVPFFLAPNLGGSRSLRGFRERRFRGNNAALFTAEYRWEAWIGLDMALFFDAGHVFEKRSDIGDLDDYRTAYGLGFRFNTSEGVFLRVDIADSTEGFKTYVTFDHVF